MLISLWYFFRCDTDEIQDKRTVAWSGFILFQFRRYTVPRKIDEKTEYMKPAAADQIGFEIWK